MHYSNTELGLDYSDFMNDKYLLEDYYSEDDEYQHDYLNDDKYELPF
jgi:hypothetical protein